MELQKQDLQYHGGTVNLQVISPFFTFRGPITITGGTVNISFSSSYSGNGSHLKREVENLRNSSGYIPSGATSGTTVQYSGSLFIVKGGTLNITGKSTTNRISLSGAGQFSADNESGVCTFPATYETSDDVEANSPLINLSDTGTVNLKYVHLTSNYNNKASGGAISVNGTSPKLTIEGCHISKCHAYTQGGAFFISTTEGGSAVVNNTAIEGCFTAAVKDTTGGTIRCVGMNMCTLELNNCEIYNNYSRLAGGAIAWNAMRIDPLTINNCIIRDNICMEDAGGVSCQSLMNITGATKIINNKSINGNGGGISVSTWGSVSAATGFELIQDGNVVLGPDVVISGNSAGGIGGAISFRVGTIKTNTGATDSADIEVFNTKSDGSLYNMSLIINGATIENNTAGSIGGAIYMLKESSSPYIMQVEMNSGLISSNYTTKDGGAVYLNGNGADFIMNGGTIKNHTSASNGGAIYTAGGSFIMYDGILENNKTSNDGTIYVSKGNFEINGGTIKNNSSANGGAVYISEGNANVKGGIIESCQATNGGAIYVSGGNVNISDGIVKNCDATNGGGICISNGNIMMDGGIIQNNQASGDGGGIYASSDSQDLTVNISSGSIIGNIAGENGGGFGINMIGDYAANVTIGLEECMGIDESHSHPIIQNNTANKNGGGFWINGDNVSMNMYCGSIEKNLALLEPGSANIYQTGGLATVYAGTVGEGVIVIGGEYDYVPDNDIPEVYITYNSNIPDNEQEKVALVTVGVEIYLPKTLFTRDGYILLGWSYEKSPTTEDTIFEAGGPYLVTDEDVTVYAVWKVIGVGKIVNPIIKAGKDYDEITGFTNVMVSSDAEVTIQMIVNDIQPDLYTNRTLTFDKYLKSGTTILMIDISNTSNRKFYYYKVQNNETNNILLDNFTNINATENYTTENDIELENESYLFIIDLPNDNNEAEAVQVKLTRYAIQNDVANIEQTVSYTTTEKREFNLKYSSKTIEDEINISYESLSPIGEDTRFIDRKMALVVTAAEGEALLEEAQIYDGTNYYKINADGKFVIPLNEVTENFDLNLKLISNTLLENEQSCNLKIELWASNTIDSENPFMGEKVAEIEKISLSAIELPAVKVEMSKRIYNVSEFDGNLKLKYNTKKVDNCKLSLEVQKKNENGIYETLSDILKSVDSVETNTNGVFEVTLSNSGTISLEINDAQNAEIGTYRILVKATKNSEEILEIPYNFIILE